MAVPVRFPGLRKIGSVGDHQTKIDELDHIIGLHDDVAGTQVPVDPFILVQVGECVSDLNAVPQALVFHPPILNVDEIAETDAFDEIHHQVLFVFRRVSVFVRPNNVGVPEDDGDLSFCGLIQANESLFKTDGFGPVQDFQGNQFSRHAVGRLPDFGHAALADPPLELKPLLDVDLLDFRPALKQPF